MAIKRTNAGRGHRYTIDGKNAVGVTTALSKGLPKPALINWAARSVAQRVVDMTPEQWAELVSAGRQKAFWDLANTHVRERNKAAVRGTDVHKLADQIVHGHEVAVPEHLYGHVEAAVAFMNDWQVTPVLSETVVGDYSYCYAGTFDLIADLPDGRRVLFDYKTSASGIWPETAVQLAAYRWASHYVAGDGTELPTSEIGITDTMAVHLRSDGYSVHPLRSDIQVFSVFHYALQIARATEVWKTWIGDAAGPQALTYEQAVAEVTA